MNVLPAVLHTCDEHHAQVRVGEALFRVAVDAHHLSPGASVQLGVRPEHMRLADPTQAHNTLPAAVRHIEKLGECSLLYLDTHVGQSPTTLKLEGTTTLRCGDALTLHAHPDDLHLFDADGLACPRTAELPR
jgi:multiple sugar transport system ATP-binding protein